MSIQIKRAYSDPAPSDGYRILVDRLWPRGISREELQIDEWIKALAPSHGLRKWFDHDPQKFDEFRKRYINELKEKPPLVDKLIEKANQETVTLLYAAKDQAHNNAVVLKQFLEERL